MINTGIILNTILFAKIHPFYVKNDSFNTKKTVKLIQDSESGNKDKRIKKPEKLLKKVFQLSLIRTKLVKNLLGIRFQMQLFLLFKEFALTVKAKFALK